VDDIASKMKAFANTVREDDHLLHGPQAGGEGLKQDDVDSMMGTDTRAQAAVLAAAASLRESEDKVSGTSLGIPSFERP
jgi:hypothetical protein